MGVQVIKYLMNAKYSYKKYQSDRSEESPVF